MPDFSSVHCFPGIESVLGAASERFFGDGHRKVTHSVQHINVDQSGEGHGRISASASVAYPSNWSVKSSSEELQPHLSTIDTIALTACLVECHLAHQRGLDHSQRGRAWLRSVQLKAGAAPQENLADIPISAQVLASRPSAAAPDWHTTTVACEIGPIKVRCEIDHEAGSANDTSAVYEELNDLLGGGGSRYYSDGYQLTQRDIKDLRIRVNDNMITAVASMSEPSSVESGIEASYRPSLSGIDGTIIAGQLAQALLYQLDGLERGAAGNLWMRRVAFRLPTPRQPVTDPFLCRLSATKNRVVAKGDNRWRVMDLSLQMLDMRGEFSVAHTLSP
ncbi:AvrD family protein [Streptomyces sp. PSKA30]|uniref:AvrD family protein n=1 Tax=Streptomyces sp. PSKA30 TaxID=2874597 RepID=UPI001CD0A8F7|nr:AvrD family protein [Streptomyces sp. PSKA30]MBZ9644982.1 hypothetical protein [Streptomyces sp. PSKA30]